MKSFFYSKFPFKKQWFYFSDPFDVPQVGAVDFFSYNRVDVPGFSQKTGLTTVIKLDKPLEEIKSLFRKKFILEQIVKGEKVGIEVSRNGKISEFCYLYRLFRKDKGLSVDQCSVVAREGIIFSAYHKNKLIAGGLFISDGKYLRAWALASCRLGVGNIGRDREIIGWANRLVIWEAIRYAKAESFYWVDLGGINPQSEKQGEQSLAEFKEAFGGERIETFFYHKTYSPTLRLLGKIKRKLSNLL